MLAEYHHCQHMISKQWMIQQFNNIAVLLLFLTWMRIPSKRRRTVFLPSAKNEENKFNFAVSCFLRVKFFEVFSGVLAFVYAINRFSLSRNENEKFIFYCDVFLLSRRKNLVITFILNRDQSCQATFFPQ